MTIWIDAQLSPAMASWISGNFSIQAIALRDLGLREATDQKIFDAARQAGAVVMTKDSDFVSLVERFGPPPQVLWLTCGNTSNAKLQQILTTTLPRALELLAQGETISLRAMLASQSILYAVQSSRQLIVHQGRFMWPDLDPQRLRRRDAGACRGGCEKRRRNGRDRRSHGRIRHHFPGGASATAASVVNRRKVKLSCKYNTTVDGE
jgi:predicted nuclease of predicted toxin-antitoxin system